MKPMRLSESCTFRSGKFLPELVYGSDRARAFLLCFQPGQGLPPRADSEEMLCCCIQGRARLTLGEETVPLSAGEIAAAGPGMIRGIEADERCVLLWLHLSKGQLGD
jgi:quercetin dioxygenase-like cupin family protein